MHTLLRGRPINSFPCSIGISIESTFFGTPALYHDMSSVILLWFAARIARSSGVQIPRRPPSRRWLCHEPCVNDPKASNVSHPDVAATGHQGGFASDQCKMNRKPGGGANARRLPIPRVVKSYRLSIGRSRAARTQRDGSLDG